MLRSESASSRRRTPPPYKEEYEKEEEDDDDVDEDDDDDDDDDEEMEETKDFDADRRLGAGAAGGALSKRNRDLEVLTSLAVALLASYCWGLYGAFAEVTFLPGSISPAAEALKDRQSASFAIGWIGRPIGAILVGQIGDTLGRRKGLALSMGIIGISTLCMAVTPFHRSTATVASHTVFRFIQGVGAGGQWAGTILLPFSTGSPKGRHLLSSLPQALHWGGLAVAAITARWAFLTHSLWAWRLGLGLGGGLCLPLALWLANSGPDTPAFEAARADGDLECCPLLMALWLQGRAMAACFLMLAVDSYAACLFFLSWGLGLHRGERVAPTLAYLSAAMAVVAASTVAGGVLIERVISQRAMYVTAALVAGAASIAWLWYMEPSRGFQETAFGCFVVFAPAVGLLQAPIPSFLAELFRTQMRYTGMGAIYMGSHLFFETVFPSAARALINVAAPLSVKLELPDGSNGIGLAVVAGLISIASAACGGYVLRYHLSGLETQQLHMRDCVGILPASRSYVSTPRKSHYRPPSDGSQSPPQPHTLRPQRSARTNDTPEGPPSISLNMSDIVQ